jgi:hypothetical protein
VERVAGPGPSSQIAQLMSRLTSSEKPTTSPRMTWSARLKR